jgi:L-erythro-3,5-diaminohexanoate dehydrogenase
MGQVVSIQSAPERQGGHPLGCHRVLQPKGVLPQAADRLDPGLPIYSNELLLEVERLNLDSASFRQIWEEQRGNPENLKSRVLQLVKQRGKMHNPVTNSGGMLLGRVLQVGKEFPEKFSSGDLIATLVSLTLTPLKLEEVLAVDSEKSQLQVRGYAILFSSGVAVKMPEDLPEETALSALDVCGAPAWVKRLVQPGDRVLILGAGKAGVLSALASLETIPGEQLILADCRKEVSALAKKLGEGVRAIQTDAREISKFQNALAGVGLFDLVIDTCNVSGTEAAAILAAKEGGRVMFFNMATGFARAVLSAEGMGKDVSLFMGNGYVKGHANYALQLVRRHRGIFQ